MIQRDLWSAMRDALQLKGGGQELVPGEVVTPTLELDRLEWGIFRRRVHGSGKLSVTAIAGQPGWIACYNASERFANHGPAKMAVITSVILDTSAAGTSQLMLWRRGDVGTVPGGTGIMAPLDSRRLSSTGSGTPFEISSSTNSGSPPVTGGSVVSLRDVQVRANESWVVWGNPGDAPIILEPGGLLYVVPVALASTFRVCWAGYWHDDG